VKQDEIGGTCSKHGRNEKCIQNFGQRTWREDTTWKIRNKCKILQWTLGKECGKVWTGCIWLRRC